MKSIKLTLIGLLLLPTGLWLLADSFLPDPLTYFSFRTPFVQYTGILGIMMMSVAMILAARPGWLEAPLGGLDKMYRLHKWLGIGGLVFSTLHWWWAQGSKWMVGWGWLNKPERGAASDRVLSGIEQTLRHHRGLAETVGEWAFYGMTALIILALIKAFPYHWFKKTHKWLAVGYLVLVYHSIVLMQFDYWIQPMSWLVSAFMLFGSLSAIVVLFGQVGRSRKIPGYLESFECYPGLGVIEGTIQLERGWPGHRPGQFAFVSDHSGEAAHPYTIASAWDAALSKLRFVVKDLGDWTSQLHDHLETGMPVTVEGPYGCFDFEDDCDRQIWIGAGIGITPFIAKLEHRTQRQEKRPVDLFYVTSVYDKAAMDKLIAAAEVAGVRLHIRVKSREGRLTADTIREAVPEWHSASIWFCGPAAFGETLRKDFQAQDWPGQHFHQELFAMR